MPDFFLTLPALLNAQPSYSILCKIFFEQIFSVSLPEQ